TSIWSLSLAQVPKSLLGRLTSILPSLDVKTARSWRGIIPLTHLARGGAYDSHHRTAGMAGRILRRGGRLAARRPRAAGRPRRACRRPAVHRGEGFARAWPLPTPAQQPATKLPTIGCPLDTFLIRGSSPRWAISVDGAQFRRPTIDART